MYKRPIKFRFWCKGTSDNPNFSKPGWWSWNNYILQKHHSLSELFESDDFVPCQFTGLVDTNQLEIYEGDVVKTNPNHTAVIIGGMCGQPSYDKGIIMWCREGFNIGQSGIGSVGLHHYAVCHCCPCGLQIIGNIFENPELEK